MDSKSDVARTPHGPELHERIEAAADASGITYAEACARVVGLLMSGRPETWDGLAWAIDFMADVRRRAASREGG